MKHPLAVYIDLVGKRCTVIGGGQIAQRRIRKLLEAGAVVQVISPQLTPTLQGLVEEFIYEERDYQLGDGQGAFLVVAATNDQDLNLAIYKHCQDSVPFINLVDDPQLSSFHFPAVVHRGRLQISVTTSGASPSLAKQIGEELAEAYGAEYEEYVELLYELRLEAKQKIKSADARKNFLEEFLSLDILTLFKKQENELIVKKVNNLCQKYWSSSL